jgi:hypothetical protein
MLTDSDRALPVRNLEVTKRPLHSRELVVEPTSQVLHLMGHLLAASRVVAISLA